MPLPTRLRIVGLTLLPALAFGCHDPTLRRPVPRTYFLVEKGPYQSLYGADNRIERLLYDRNGDRIADAVILYSPDGTVRQAEIDTDLDRIVDRWEYFDGGVLVRLGLDDNGDGTPDRLTSVR